MNHHISAALAHDRIAEARRQADERRVVRRPHRPQEVPSTEREGER